MPGSIIAGGELLVFYCLSCHVGRKGLAVAVMYGDDGFHWLVPVSVLLQDIIGAPAANGIVGVMLNPSILCAGP